MDSPSTSYSPGIPNRLRRFSTLKEPTDNGKHKPLPVYDASTMFIEPVPELRSEIHRQFREAHAGHRPHAGLDPARASTGVVWCTERAYQCGFNDEPDAWANLGQGAPEVEDEIPHAFPKPHSIDVSVAAREYAPTAGIKHLREAVAHLYNEHHRKGKASQYTWENVCIVPGGRAGLIRIAAVLGNAYLGFFIPDYTVRFFHTFTNARFSGLTRPRLITKC